jgi:hypothetical protein
MKIPTIFFDRVGRKARFMVNALVKATLYNALVKATPYQS